MTGHKSMGKQTIREMLTEFFECGGQAIEVVSGSHTPEQYAEFARYAAEFNLLCSCGSDFHGPGESYRDLGRLPDFPSGCRPVWEVNPLNELIFGNRSSSPADIPPDLAVGHAKEGG